MYKVTIAQHYDKLIGSFPTVEAAGMFIDSVFRHFEGIEVCIEEVKEDAE